MKVSYNEFHISKIIRDKCNFNEGLFASSGNVVFANLKAVKEFQVKLNNYFEEQGLDDKKVSAGSINAMGLIDEIFHYVCMLFRKNRAPKAFTNLVDDLDNFFGKEQMDVLYKQFMEDFPPTIVYKKKISADDYLFQSCIDEGTSLKRDNREQVLEEMILLHLANENPAFHPFQILFDDRHLTGNPNYIKTWNQIKAYFKTQPIFGPKNNDLISMLKEPVIAAPTSLKGQLDYIRLNWASVLGDWIKRLLEGIDTISEEEKAAWTPMSGAGPEMCPPDYNSLIKEYERFSPDREWMPKVVLMAKTVLVWLYQLSKKYNRDINRLDQIPDEELDALRDEGFTGLWLIGLWQRSNASKRIKQINGNPEAAASAYSLLDYEIADNLGGWEALENLRMRCWQRGIRLASDMVPNHTGMDGTWVTEHPDYFVTTKECPFPQYTFNGENLSHDPRVAIYLEDHYYSKTDCAVCFKRVDTYTGDVTYIYHGNDGTGMPWNDTAQIDFLNPVAREAVMQQILRVARNFPIIRFDAAMVLAKKHIRRLWYPEPGHGGDIATRSQYALSNEEFEQRIPNEFWREVVDRCAVEMPDTLLLAEAFWMMEGYFTRTLGMHRVYNSAFMNMLKKEENQKYRDTVKNTIKFDPQILKRFVNFMNNPDEETAVAQFGDSDKYFGVCTLMITMPGLPMFGHGQLEGFTEKYGMEYTRSYKDEKVNEGLYNAHKHLIFPILHKRYLFAGVENFLFYDVWNNGNVNENIYAYSNSAGNEYTVVFVNNKYEPAAGWIKQSCEYAVKTGSGENDVQMVSRSLAQGLNLIGGDNRFVIFREHKSGLWYIRRSNEIINNGLFVYLNGFEAQIYLDIHEVEDTAENKYSTLCNLLNGSGTPDIEIAWQEYHYKELYDALEKLASPEFYSNMITLFTPIPQLKAKGLKSITPATLFASIEKDAMEYFEIETKFALNEKDLPAEIVSDKTATKKKSITQKAARINEKAATMTQDKRYAAFCKEIEFLFTAYSEAQGEETAKSVKSAVKATFNSVIYDGILSDKLALIALCAFAVVSSAGSDNCRKWGLSRKLSEIAEKGGLNTTGLKDVLDRIFILMKIRDMNFGASGQAKAAYDAACLIADSEYSGLLSGANNFNEILWFNKERMESTLWYMFAANVMYSPRILREQIYRLYRTLDTTQKAAEYKCLNFTEALKPENPAKVAKSSGTRTRKTAKSDKADKSEKTEKSVKSKKSVKDSQSSK